MGYSVYLYIPPMLLVSFLLPRQYPRYSEIGILQILRYIYPRIEAKLCIKAKPVNQH